MDGDVKAVRRAYNSPLRAGQAQETRRRVLDAARELFIDRGYAGTTVAAVADRSGVSPQTVYLSLGGKRGLLTGVIETAITGPDDAPGHDDAWWEAIDEVADAAERLARIIDFSCSILERTAPIHVIIRGAADKEAFAAALGRRLLEERLQTQTERIRRYLRGDLAPGVTVIEAGERYCALTSPELHHVLTDQLGWRPDRYRRWLSEVLTHELLDGTR
jgi:AcrR family transcriptional regulator